MKAGGNTTSSTKKSDSKTVVVGTDKVVTGIAVVPSDQGKSGCCLIF